MSNKIALDALTEDQWLELAERHASKDWDCAKLGGYLSAVKSLCEDFAAIAALEAMEAGGWLPIANAPKDCEILLFCKFCGVVRGRWNDCRYANKPRPYWTHDRERVFGVAACRSDQPTHWVPLPTPPKD
jgi:hypothetical protein